MRAQVGRATILARSHAATALCVANVRSLTVGGEWDILDWRVDEADVPPSPQASGVAGPHGILDLAPIQEATCGSSPTVPRPAETPRGLDLSGLPRVVGPGAAEFLTCGPAGSPPPGALARKCLKAELGEMYWRLWPEEMAVAATALARNLNETAGVVAVLIPLGGFSSLSGPGGPLHDPEGDRVFACTLSQLLRPNIPVVNLDCNINDRAYGEAVVARLREAIRTDREQALAYWTASGMS